MNERFQYYRDRIPIAGGKIQLTGDLVLPENTHAIILFSHGGGIDRLSPRNKAVAEYMQEKGLGTFLVDLLTEQEAGDHGKEHDIGLLASRLISVTAWLQESRPAVNYRLGYYGTSTGAAAALKAAAALSGQIGAIVCRGGRPDLAMEVLDKVEAPTLLIVGGRDEFVLQLNREALELLPGDKKLEVIGGATHLFEEPGMIQSVAEMAVEWFSEHLKPVPAH